MRTLARSLALFVALAAVAGCAAMQMTLAQELAWDQWKKCDNFTTVGLKEVRVDGQIWVTYQSRGEYDRWVECIRKAQQEQAGRVGVVAAPAGVVIAPQTPAAPAPVPSPVVTAPAWKQGSEWAYRWESPQGRGTFVWVVDGEETLDGIQVYVVRSGQRRIFYRRSDLALYVDENERQVETRYLPPFVEYAWPLEPGKKWEQEVTRERPKERQTQVITYSCEIAGQPEAITVPAGTFSALRISCRNKTTVGADGTQPDRLT